MHSDNDSLPDFTNPPVDETAFSIQFPPISGFDVRHFGLYWTIVRDEYPGFKVLPPIPNQMEIFGTAPAHQYFLPFQLVAEPEIRCWFVDASGTRLFQVQRDRFVHNWRKVIGNELYPRYPASRDLLSSEWHRFCTFLEQQGLNRPHVNQCEVTYINHIEYERGWNNYGELSKVITTWIEPSEPRFLPAPERVNMEVHYSFPDNLGRLHVSLQPVIRARDGHEVLQLTMTARGAPKSSASEDVLSWLDLGRAWVVKGFADFTTRKLQELWGRK